MSQAGCGPTSLAIIMDYLLRLERAQSNHDEPVCYVGTTPKDTMEYTSAHGRKADKDKKESSPTYGTVVPQGTDGTIMMRDISTYWPDFEGEKVLSVDDAARFLRMGSPLVFACRGCTTYKLNAKGEHQNKTYPGHFMVLVGVESGDKTFWISDPALTHTTHISRGELEGKNNEIWRIYRK